MKDIRQDPRHGKYLTTIGWKVEKINNTLAYAKKMPILGHFLKVQRPQVFTSETLDELLKLRKKYRAFRIVVEPSDSKQEKILLKGRFRRIKVPFVPSKTLRLDLTKPLSEINAGFSKDARQSIKKGSRLKIKKVKNSEKFHEIWKKSVPKTRYVLSVKQLKDLRRIYGNDCLLLSASHNKSNEIIGGSVFLRTQTISYYWHAFTNKKGRASLASYSLLWEGIKWAKKGGSKVFDFEGIYDERFPNKRWRGFTIFKKKFGGKIKNFPGAYQKLFIPF